MGHIQKASSRAQRRANKRQAGINQPKARVNSKRNTTINEGVQQLINPNAAVHIYKIAVKENIVQSLIRYNVDFANFKEAVLEQIEKPSSDQEIQGYIRDALQEFEETGCEHSAAIGTFSFLVTSSDVMSFTLEKYAKEQTFGIIFLYFIDKGQIQIECKSTGEWEDYVARFN